MSRRGLNPPQGGAGLLLGGVAPAQGRGSSGGPPALDAITPDIATASHDGDTFGFTSTDATPRGIRFNGDGSRYYVAGGSNDRVYLYETAAANQLAGATHDGSNFFTTTDNAPVALWVSADETTIFVAGDTSNVVEKYTGTAGDLTTFTLAQTLNINLHETNPLSLDLNPDMTVLVIGGRTEGGLNRWDLSTAGDLNTASHVSAIDLSAADADGNEGVGALYGGGTFSADGLRFYAASDTTDRVTEWETSTAWDITGLTQNPLQLYDFDDLFSASVCCLTLSADGTRMALLEFGADVAYGFAVGLWEDFDLAAEVSDLRVWWDGSDESSYTVDGSNRLTAWTNKGSGWGATGVVGSPLISSQSIRWDNEVQDDYPTVAGITLTNRYTTYAVWRLNGMTAGTQAYFYDASASDTHRMSYDGTFGLTLIKRDGSDNANVSTNDGVFADSTKWNVTWGLGQFSTVEVKNNAGALASDFDSGAAGGSTSSTYSMGGSPFANTSLELAELIHFEGLHTDSSVEQVRVMAYLANKWYS